MLKFFQNLISFDFKPANGTPLKYRESNYTIAELEKRLVSEVNGFKNRGW